MIMDESIKIEFVKTEGHVNIGDVYTRFLNSYMNCKERKGTLRARSFRL